MVHFKMIVKDSLEITGLSAAVESSRYLINNLMSRTTEAQVVEHMKSKTIHVIFFENRLSNKWLGQCKDFYPINLNLSVKFSFTIHY